MCAFTSRMLVLNVSKITVIIVNLIFQITLIISSSEHKTAVPELVAFNRKAKLFFSRKQYLFYKYLVPQMTPIVATRMQAVQGQIRPYEIKITHCLINDNTIVLGF